MNGSSASSWVCGSRLFFLQELVSLTPFSLFPSPSTFLSFPSQLKAKITRAMAAREQKQRKRSLQKYIPDCCNAIWAVLEAMAGAVPRGPKRQRVEGQTDVISKVWGRLGKFVWRGCLGRTAWQGGGGRVASCFVWGEGRVCVGCTWSCAAGLTGEACDRLHG